MYWIKGTQYSLSVAKGMSSPSCPRRVQVRFYMLLPFALLDTLLTCNLKFVRGRGERWNLAWNMDNYLCSKKTEVSLVVLHIITFHSSNYGLSLYFALELWNNDKFECILIFKLVKPNNWPYISRSIIRAVEHNYMQNDRADLNFRSKWVYFLGS